MSSVPVQSQNWVISPLVVRIEISERCCDQVFAALDFQSAVASFPISSLSSVMYNVKPENCFGNVTKFEELKHPCTKVLA